MSWLGRAGRQQDETKKQNKLQMRGVMCSPAWGRGGDWVAAGPPRRGKQASGASECGRSAVHATLDAGVRLSTLGLQLSASSQHSHPLPMPTTKPTEEAHLDAGGLHAEAVQSVAARLDIAQALCGALPATAIWVGRRGAVCLAAALECSAARAQQAHPLLPWSAAQLGHSRRPQGCCGQGLRSRPQHGSVQRDVHLHASSPKDGALVGQGAALHLQVALGLQLIESEVARKRGLLGGVGRVRTGGQCWVKCRGAGCLYRGVAFHGDGRPCSSAHACMVQRHHPNPPAPTGLTPCHASWSTPLLAWAMSRLPAKAAAPRAARSTQAP